MLLQLQHVFKYFGSNPILEDVCATVEPGDRIGLVGINGAGKSTLLKIIMGDLQPDNGLPLQEAEVRFATGKTVGYLEQLGDMVARNTLYDEAMRAFTPELQARARLAELEQLMSAAPTPELLQEHGNLSTFLEGRDGYNLDSRVKKVLYGMGFGPETHQKRVEVLSGGERTRLGLCKLLLQKPDILILDEPTNHLDFITLHWLEEHLKEYKGAVLAVSHDRYFLDAVCTRIWELEHRHLTVYKGNYAAFVPQKEHNRQAAERQRKAQLEEAKKLQEYVDKNLVRASTTKMAQSRRKQLEKLEITQVESVAKTQVRLQFTYDAEPYNEVLTVKDVTLAVPGRVLAQNISFALERGDRLIIAGPNGTGKSTLLKTIMGLLPPESGSIRRGTGLKTSSFAQILEPRGGRVIDAIWDKYPHYTELEVRSLLARFAFRGEDVFKSAATLSGGELARLRFAEIYLERANCLYLDEPTNHLDIYMRQVLSEALAEFSGTLLLVTHDRYLMQLLGCPILYIEQDKTTLYPNYAAMERALLVPAATPAPTKPKAEPKEGPGKNLKENRRQKAELRNALKKAEQEVERLSAEIEALEQKLQDPEVSADHLALQEVCAALEQAKSDLDTAYELWGELSEKMEQFAD